MTRAAVEAGEESKTGAVRKAGDRRGPALWWQLLRIGWSAGRATEGARLRFVALLLAAAAFTMVALATMGAVAVYDGRDAREQTRGPVLAEKGDRPALLWRGSTDAISTTPHDVLYVEPLEVAGGPPPGLPRWPAPGEVFLSPELARVGAAEGIRTRYGRFAGLIDKNGLVSPTERLAYIRPQRPPEKGEKWYAGTGFGSGAPSGETLRGRPLHMVLLAMGALLWLPAGTLVVIAVRIGSRPRDRRNTLLQTLGAGRRHRAMVDIGEAALPVLLGTATAGLIMSVFLLADIRLPLTRYAPAADYLRAAWPSLAATAAASFAVVLAFVVALHPAAKSGGGTSPRSAGERVPRWRLAAFGAAVALVATSQYAGGKTGLFMFIAGTMGIWVFVPSVAAVLSRWLGGRIARLGRRGCPGALIGGRWAHAHPGVLIRLVTATVIGLGLIMQLQLWSSRLGDMASAAAATQHRIGNSVLTVDGGVFTRDRLAEFTRRLPAGSHVLQIRNTEDPEQGLIREFTAPCRVWQTLRIPCPTSRTAWSGDGADARSDEIATWFGPAFRGASATSKRKPADSLIVVSDRIDAAHKNEVRQAAYAVWNGPRVWALGDDWLLGADGYSVIGRWLTLFGSTGFALLMLAVGIGIAAEFLRFGTALAPLAVLTGRPQIFLATALWNLTLPMMIAVLMAAAFTAWDGLLFISTVHDGHLSVPLLTAMTSGALIAAVLIGIVGGLTARQAALRWLPTAD